MRLTGALLLLCGIANSAGIQTGKAVTGVAINTTIAKSVPKQMWNDLTFFAPLTESTVVWGRGSTTPTYTRNSIATYLNPTTGLITTVQANIPRFEADGYLSEGARTNSLLYSNSPNGSGWVNANCTVTQFTDTSPDGTLSAHTIGAVTASASLYQPLSLAGAAYTASIYIKRKNGTGTIYVTANAGTATGWTISTVTTSFTRITDTDTTGNPSFGIRFETAGDSVIIYGADLEAGAFASSYIPTTTAAVPRAADVLTYPYESNAKYGTSDGTWVNTSMCNNGNTTVRAEVGGFTPSGNNRFQLRFCETSDNRMATRYGTGGATILFQGGSTVMGTPQKISQSYGLSGGDFHQNGVLLGSSSVSSNITPTANGIEIGQLGLTNNLYGNTSKWNIFSSRLTGWELSLLK